MNEQVDTEAVTVDELQWYVVLAETEHMTEAAARLNVAQPTLSRALARLERRLGTPLFDRVHRRLRLNRYGEILLEHARRCLAELSVASDRIASLLDPDRGTVRLAFLHSVATWLVPELLRRYREGAPEVRFELRQAAGHEMLADLRAGHVDLAVSGPRPEGGDIGWQPLFREQLCLVVPERHALAGRGRCGLAAAAGEPFVALRRGFGMREISDELCSAAGFTPAIAFESTEIPSMEGLVAAGLGVAVAPLPRAHRATPGVAYLPLTDAGAHRVIGLAWPLDRPVPPVAERFAEFVRSRRWS
ncbi:MAG: LysR family transcriptional regulator, transcription activator of glutamate synthase operon [Pseudonocardiales bacterium]|nr:LysR family transcriptional regulator, transcription activator of glutamate synthase operon [Pseudonocardiales bacterium]